MPALRHVHGGLFLRQTDPESSMFLEDWSLVIFIIINIDAYMGAWSPLVNLGLKAPG